jgi:hypothetical protein
MTIDPSSIERNCDMNEESHLDNDGFLYDAILAQLDASRGTLVFIVGDATHRVNSPHVLSFSLGAIGRLRLPTEPGSFAFQMYADQRLRRTPELDDVRDQRWGWRIGERRFTVKSGLLPGHNGAVVSSDTDALTLALPREFVHHCQSRQLTPASVLRAFVGDLCALSSPFERPREDGYSSGGSVQSELARAYFQRAFEDVGDPAHPGKLKGVKRRRRQPVKRPAAEGVPSGEAKR